MKRGVLVICLALVSVVLSFDSVSAQTGRVLTQQGTHNQPHPIPIRTCGLAYQGKAIQYDQTFVEANDLWFNDLNICVRNVSTQTITQIDLELWVPHKSEPKHAMGLVYTYTGSLAPNATAQLAIEEPHSQVDAKYDYTRFALRIDGVLFGNNQMWYDGNLHQYNAATDSWEVVSSSNRSRPSTNPFGVDIIRVVHRTPSPRATSLTAECNYEYRFRQRRTCHGYRLNGSPVTCRRREDTTQFQPLCTDPFYYRRDQCGTAEVIQYLCGETPCATVRHVPCGTIITDF